LLAKFGPRHPLADELHSPEVEAAIERLGTGPGLVVLDEVWMAPYIDAARRTGRQLVYDSHNVETVLRRQIVSVGNVGLARKVRREMITAQVKRLERRLVTETDQVWVCSEDDRVALDQLFGPLSHIRVVPNGVDTSTVTAEAGAMPVPPQLEYRPPSIIFLGDLAYTPNEDGALYLLDEVLPAMDLGRGEAQVVLVGRRPTNRLKAAAAARENVEVTGEVDEVVPYLVHGDVLAVTLRVGGGTRLKILEAMAAGLPIVTTSKGLEGIDAEHGTHVLIADDPAALAAAITEILTDPALGAGLVEQARELVDRCYSWNAIARLIADATADLIPARS
jgi:glycosyltransferase involved in cell wall biosynthesis